MTGETLTTWRERLFLWQRIYLNRALARFTFVADATTGAKGCRLAGDGQTPVARYDHLPCTAIAFCSEMLLVPSVPSALGSATLGAVDPSGRVRALTWLLVAPGEKPFCVVDEDGWALPQAAYRVLDGFPERQMSLCADPLNRDPVCAVGPERPTFLQ